MSDEIEYKIEQGDKLTSLPYSAILDADYLKSSKEDLSSIFLLSAWQGETPLALAAVSLSNIAEIQSFFYSDQRYIKKMIELIEIESKRRGADLLAYTFHENIFIQAALDQRAWHSQVMSTDFYIEIATLHPSWFRFKPLPTGFKFKNWKDASHKEKEQIEDLAQDENLPVVQREYKYPIEDNNALILLYLDEIAGLMQTHRVSKNIIAYTSIVILKKYRHKALETYLLTQAITRHQKTKVPIALFTLNKHLTNKEWHHFIKKRLSIHTYHTLNTIYSFKNLKS